MAYTNKDFKTKKALKDAIKNGDDVRCYEPGLGPDLSDYTGSVTLEGPHYPKPHTWYGNATLVNGKVIKVS